MACNGLQDCSKVQVTEFPFHKTGRILGKSKIIPWGGNKKTAQSSISNSRPFVSFFLHCTGTFTTQRVSFEFCKILIE